MIKMLFCKKCGGLLIPKEGKMFCKECNSVCEDGILREKKKKGKEMGVMNKVDEHLPETKADCPKCGHGKAYYWTLQTRGADEPETIFFKCVKCGNIWRQY